MTSKKARLSACNNTIDCHFRRPAKRLMHNKKQHSPWMHNKKQHSEANLPKKCLAPKALMHVHTRNPIVMANKEDMDGEIPEKERRRLWRGKLVSTPRRRL